MHPWTLYTLWMTSTVWTTWAPCLDTLLALNTLTIDFLSDIEYYAIYDPNILSVILTMLLFKPIEHLIEKVIADWNYEFFLQRIWRVLCKKNS